MMQCNLCGLDSGGAAFCCAGCENVYAILLESGVLASGQDFRQTELYQESLRLGIISRGAQSPAAIPSDAESREAIFRVFGMWCTSCAWLIEHALTSTHGIVSAEVHFASDLLKVRYCPQYLPLDRVFETVRSLGYRIADFDPHVGPSDAERRDLVLRTGVAAFLWMNAMTFSLVIYASYFERITASFSRYIPLILMAIATPAVFYCAAPVLRIAWAGARTATLRMESLLAMGILLAYGYSAVLAFQGSNHVYFDTVCAIVTLVLTGKTIERAAKEKTARAMALLYGLMPNKARLIQDGRERFISMEALQPGTIFRVKSGERVPADGVVVEGSSHADESVLTGESAPRPKSPGDAVIGGSINTGAVLDIRATRMAADSRLAQIVHSVEQAATRKTRIERTVDRVSRIFIPAVLALAILTFAGWQWRTGRVSESLMHAIAVLVIACPCALGIATPLALTGAVTAAGRHGILAADASVLETIRSVDVMVIDKTGTATEGEFALLETIGDTSRMAELTALESYSEHPIGKALRQGVAQVTALRILKGLGIAGEIGGTRYTIGNGPLFGSFHWRIDPITRPNCTVAYFGWDNEVRGAFLLGDRIRPEASEFCAGLQRRGIRTVLLSGDSAAATEPVARTIGADEWDADATPDQKVAFIRELQAKGAVVAMAGDGVNDAPSLAQADLGIALGSGADIAMQAAPLVVMTGSLHTITEILDLARRTFRIVRQNLFWAFVYNVAGISLAMAGVLNPIMAAGAMVLSGLSVIGNSRRL